MNILVDAKNRIYIPTNLLNKFLKEMHLTLGHIGESKLFSTLSRFWIGEHLHANILKTVRNCQECHRCTIMKKGYGKFSGIREISNFNELVSSDIVGPFFSRDYITTHEKDKFSIITIIDHYSRFAHLAILEETTSEAIKEVFRDWFSMFEKPLAVLTDCGRQYISQNFRSFLQANQIKHKTTIPYSPQTNAISERINSTINKVMRVERGKNIDEIVEIILKALNWTVHRILKLAPYEIVYNRSPLDPLNRTIETNKIEILENKKERV